MKEELTSRKGRWGLLQKTFDHEGKEIWTSTMINMGYDSLNEAQKAAERKGFKVQDRGRQ